MNTITYDISVPDGSCFKDALSAAIASAPSAVRAFESCVGNGTTPSASRKINVSIEGSCCPLKVTVTVRW